MYNNDHTKEHDLCSKNITTLIYHIYIHHQERGFPLPRQTRGFPECKSSHPKSTLSPNGWIMLQWSKDGCEPLQPWSLLHILTITPIITYITILAILFILTIRDLTIIFFLNYMLQITINIINHYSSYYRYYYHYNISMISLVVSTPLKQY